MNRCLMVLVALFFVAQEGLYGQQSVNSGGGIASGTAGNVSYSIGQVFQVTKTGSSGSVNEGVQVPFEIANIGTVAKSVHVSLKAFPNPTSKNLILQFDNVDYLADAYKIYDQSGKIVSVGLVASEETTIPFSEFPSAIYFVEVLKNNQSIHTFQIIKK